MADKSVVARGVHGRSPPSPEAGYGGTKLLKQAFS